LYGDGEKEREREMRYDCHVPTPEGYCTFKSDDIDEYLRHACRVTNKRETAIVEQMSFDELKRRQTEKRNDI